MGDSLETMIAAGECAREERQARHACWKAENLAALRASGLRFGERPEMLLFREPGKPRVNFYPSTGRWAIPDRNGGRCCGGGHAARFIDWYRKQTTPTLRSPTR